nr:hypothetical protein [Tanacetum cinerariifolium]
NDEPQSSCDARNKDYSSVNKDSGINAHEKSANSINDVNTVGPTINTACANFDTGSQNINIVSLIVSTASPKATHADFLSDQPEGDMSNINTTYQVPSTPNTRIHKDHSLDLVIGNVQSGVETMQEELLQFKLQKVWILVDLPKGKKAIEGIDCDEVFAPIARIKAIRLFLAYASFMGFMVYQMDVKSNFLYGRIEEEVYVCQPLGFEDPDHPDKVYKVVKALYGLHQALRAWFETLAKYLLGNGFYKGKIDQTLFIMRENGDILHVQVYVNDIIFGSTKKELCNEFESLMKDSQDKNVTEVLRKFNHLDAKTANTPVDTEKPLVKDADGDDVDVHLYRSMIGSLMYLTASRPNIMYEGEGSTVPVESHHTPSGAPTTSQPPLSSPSRIPTRQETKVPQPSSPTHTHVADEAASMGMDVRYGGSATTITGLDAGQGSDSMEADLKQTKQVSRATYTNLIMKVKRLEKPIKSSQVRRRAKIVVSEDEELEDLSKQVRSMIEEIDQDIEVTLVLAEVAKVHTYTRRRRRAISTASGGISTAKESVGTAGASMPVSTAGMVDKAIRLQEQLDEKERQRIARVHKEASSFNVDEWEDIQATIEADEELALSIQAGEREKYFEAKKERLLQLKRLSFDELKNLFEATMKTVQTFTPIKSDIDRTIPKIADESSKGDAKKELEQESSKKQKTRESSEPREKEDDEMTQEYLQQMMMMVPVEEVYVEALQAKYPIIDWEFYIEESRKY